MSYGFRDVTRNNPCPVCGKDHWCSWLPTEYGQILFCFRTDADGSVAGLDGNIYRRCGTSKTGACVYEEESQYNKRVGDFKTSNAVGKAVSKKEYVPMTVIDEVKPLKRATLHTIYNEFLDMLVVDDIHREWLHKEGWSDELIEKFKIRSMPIDDYKRYNSKWYKSSNKWRKSICEALFSKFGSLRGVPGFYKKNGVWKIHSRSGIVFPMFDENKNLYRLRVRMDFLDNISEKQGNLFIDGKGNFVEPLKGVYVLENGKKVFQNSGGKYRNFSSFKEDEEERKNGFIKNIYEDGCQANNALSLYCVPEDDFYLVYVTEGEKKGIIGNHILKAPFITLPGVNSFNLMLNKNVLDYLRNKGTKIILIAYDADKATNEAVFKAEQRVVEALQKEGFMVALAEWDGSIGKGIDDILVKGYRPSFVMP